MNKHGIIPHVLDKSPTLILEVTYNNNDQVLEGNELTPTVVKNEPTVKWNSEAGSLYTLLMIDPDAPSRLYPKYRVWHHWLVGNIPENNISKGETLSEYIGAGPSKGSGLHRYILILFKQVDKINYREHRKFNKTSGRGRGKFSTRNFAEKYNLGDPIAGNFFQAKWDTYVPLLYKQLTEN